MTNMKFDEFMEIFKCNYAVSNAPKGVIFLPFTLLLILLLFHLNTYHSSSEISSTSLETTETKKCNIFSGNWENYTKTTPYYSNESCPFIAEKLNCFMHGRPDREFLKWRWRPDECELPLFDANQFLKIVRGKSMAFVGDSIGRNQMESLLCLLNSVAHPVDVTHIRMSDPIYSKWWFYADYNFTVALLWSPFLVKSTKTYINDSSFYNPETLYLDEADQAWSSQAEKFDYVIVSGGQWFFRPLTFYENGTFIGCQKCNNSSELNFYGYKYAFRTALRTLANLKGFKGLAFLVTHSPNHFENGAWNKGGGCNRTRPVAKEEKTQVHPYGLETLHQIQVEEFSAAKEEARKKGLRFGLIDITDAMLMRPDGHPHKYGHSLDKNVSVNDCVHWCMPGPVDTWNEFLLYMMKLDRG